MMKLLSYQEQVKGELLKHKKNLLFAPPGTGMDVAIVAALKETKGTKLIIDGIATKSMWRRLLESMKVDAAFVTPEKLSLDYRTGVEYTFDNVVWNVTSRGESILGAAMMAANNADRVIIRRLEFSMERIKLLRGFQGPFNVIHLISNDDGIYPLLNKKLDPSAILKRLGL